MGIQAFVPSGGGGTPGFDYIASIRMETYNRSWAQGGAAGNYILTSNNNNSGYVYFVGATTTGSPLGKVVNVSHAFTRLDIIAPTGDYMSLHKAAVKPTTVFANPFAAFSSFPSQITSSGNFVLPTSALPLVDALIVGAGGSGGGHHAGGGGGGGGIVKLTGYQAVGTTSITIGAGAGHNNSHGFNGGATFFGNVYAIGGGGGSANATPLSGVNLGANGGGSLGGTWFGYSNETQGIGPSSAHYSKVTAGFGTQTGTATYVGGHAGGARGANHAGGGGGGAGGVGGNGSGSSPGAGGPGHISNITGSDYTYSSGGGGGSHSPDNGHGSNPGGYGAGSVGAHNGPQNNAGSGTQGVVVVRYYIA
jgi:hypothetical protein